MQTAIRSRARSALTILAVLLTAAIVVAAVLFAVHQAFPTPTYHWQSYDLTVTPSPPWHAGQSLSLQWVRSDANGSEPPPASVTCHFYVYGPYATRDAAQAGMRGSSPGEGATLAASGPLLTLSTNVAASAPKPVAYTLPDTLAPGYYVVVGSVDFGDRMGGDTSGWVAQVDA